jgi:L-lactate dehydrogenase complex protein LldF
MFLEADVGISGVNLGVAETGSLVLVTNEGNGRMVTSLPPVHIAVMGIERLAPDWKSAAVWLSLLSRAATGQALSIYTSVITGPARQDDIDGPEEVHIILLDNQRSSMIGTRYEEILQCIRCGACLSACPVYGEAGGHAYHSPYSGPIGAVISPLLFGLENYSGLPQASTLCGACLEVCPSRIDLPRMLLALRVDSVEQGLVPTPTTAAEKVSAKMMNKPGWMQIFFKMGRFGQLIMKLFNISINGFERYPMVARRSFREMWKQMEADDDSQG